MEKLLQPIQLDITCRSSLMILLAAMHLVKSKEFSPLIISNSCVAVAALTYSTNMLCVNKVKLFV